MEREGKKDTVMKYSARNVKSRFDIYIYIFIYVIETRYIHSNDIRR